MDCSSPGFSVHGILQARILEWVAISSSGGSSWPRDRTHVSYIARWILYHWATRWWFQSWSVRAHLEQKRLGNTEGCSPQPLQRPAAAVLQGPLPVEAQGQAALFPPLPASPAALWAVACVSAGWLSGHLFQSREGQNRRVHLQREEVKQNPLHLLKRRLMWEGALLRAPQGVSSLKSRGQRAVTSLMWPGTLCRVKQETRGRAGVRMQKVLLPRPGDSVPCAWLGWQLWWRVLCLQRPPPVLSPELVQAAASLFLTPPYTWVVCRVGTWLPGPLCVVLGTEGTAVG